MDSSRFIAYVESLEESQCGVFRWCPCRFLKGFHKERGSRAKALPQVLAGLASRLPGLGRGAVVYVRGRGRVGAYTCKYEPNSKT